MNIIIAMMSLINEDILATIIGTSPTSLLNNNDMDSQINNKRKHKIVNTIIYIVLINNQIKTTTILTYSSGKNSNMYYKKCKQHKTALTWIVNR